MSLALLLSSWLVAAHVRGLAVAFGLADRGVLVMWVWLLTGVTLFTEIAHHCTAHDEDRTIATARIHVS